MQAYDKVVPRSKHRKLFQMQDDEDEDAATQPPPTANRDAKKEPPPDCEQAWHLIVILEKWKPAFGPPLFSGQLANSFVQSRLISHWLSCINNL